MARSLDCSEGSPLGKAADIAGALTLQGARCSNHIGVTSEVTQPPPGHGPTLGKAVHGEAAVLEVGSQCGKAVVGVAIGQEVFVDLIAHDQQLGMTAQELRQGEQFFP